MTTALSNKAIDLFNSIDATAVKERRALFTPETGEYTLFLTRKDIEFDEKGVDFTMKDGTHIVRPTLKCRYTILQGPGNKGAGEVFYDDRLEIQSLSSPEWDKDEKTKRAKAAYEGNLGRWKANLALLTGSEVTSFGDALMQALAQLPDDDTGFVIEANIRTGKANDKGWRRVSVSYRKLVSIGKVEAVATS